MKIFNLVVCILFLSVYVNSQPIMVGHRGSYWGVENTEEAFIKGAQEGYKGLECDVRVTADGEYIISHDVDLSRLGHSSVSVETSTLEDLKKLTLTQTRGGVTYTGTICTVEEYLDICVEYNCFPVIELKWTTGIHWNASGNNNYTNIPGLVELVQKKGLADKAVFLTSMKGCLEYIRENYPDMQLQYLTREDWADHFDWCVENRIDVDIQVGSYINEETIERFHKENLKVNVWTVNTVSDYKLYRSYGCDMITTDYFKPSELNEIEDMELTHVWTISQQESGYLTIGSEQRSMAMRDGLLYIPNRTEGIISVVSGIDGSLQKNLHTTVSGWFINCVDFTKDGVMIVGSSFLEADSLYFHTCDINTGECTLLDSVYTPGLGRSDYFAVYGELDSSEGGYLVSASNYGKAAIIPMADGKLQAATVINGHGGDDVTSSQAIVKDENSFFITGRNLPRQLYKIDGSGVEDFGGAIPGTAVVSGKCFTFNGREYYVSAEDRYGTFQVLDITDGIGKASAIDSPTFVLGENANTALTTPICVDVKDDYVMIYVLAVNNGLAAYKLVSTNDGNSIQQGNTNGEAIRVFMRNNELIVGIETDEIIEVYDLYGRLLKNQTGKKGENVISGLERNQVFIVKVGNYVSKVSTN